MFYKSTCMLLKQVPFKFAYFTDYHPTYFSVCMAILFKQILLMAKRFSIGGLFFIIPACLFLSCSPPKPLEYRTFKNLTIEKVGFGSSSVKMELVYYNPNHFGLQLKRTDLDIYLDNNYAGHTSQEYQVTIPRQSEFTLPIALDVDMKNIYKNVLTTLLDKEIDIKLAGTVKVGKANVFITFPVNYEAMQTFTY